MDCSLAGSSIQPRDFPGKSTGMGCQFLLWEIFPAQEMNLGFPHCRQMLLASEPPGKLLQKDAVKATEEQPAEDKVYGKQGGASSCSPGTSAPSPPRAWQPGSSLSPGPWGLLWGRHRRGTVDYPTIVSSSLWRLRDGAENSRLLRMAWDFCNQSQFRSTTPTQVTSLEQKTF